MDAYRREYLENSVMGKVPNRVPGSHYLPEGARVYIAGPLVGDSKEVFGLFADAARQRGWVPINSQEISPSHEGECLGAEIPVGLDEPAYLHRYGCYMRPSLEALLTCDAALFLPGWARSTSARVKREVAAICGLTIIEHYEIHEVEGGA